MTSRDRVLTGSTKRSRPRRAPLAAWAPLLVTAPAAVVLMVMVAVYWQHAVTQAKGQVEAQGLRDAAHVIDSIRHGIDHEVANLQAIGYFLSQQPELRQLMFEGYRAVRTEGGGAGGPRAAAVREELHRRLGSAWQATRTRFGLRQLHVHIGPGDTSFYRAHLPDRFGDDLSSIRKLVVQCIETGEATGGFERGRVWPGLRGVVPLQYAPARAMKMHTFGALEVGVAIDRVLHHAVGRVNIDVVATLELEGLRDAMWDPRLRSFIADRKVVAGHVIEASAGEPASASSMLRFAASRGLLESGGGVMGRHADGRWLVVAVEPWHGHAQKGPIGRLAASRDLTGEVEAAIAAAQRRGGLFALMGLLVVLGVYGLTFAVQRGTRRIIAHQTAELAASESRFREVTEGFGLTVWETDLECRLTAWSGPPSMVPPGSAQQVCGRPLYQLMPAHERERVRGVLAEAMSKGQPFRDLVHEAATPAGETRWVQVMGLPLRGRGGELTGYQGVAMDVTAERAAKAETLERQRALEALAADLEVACRAADRASEAKSRFLANMSHEIRTPMNSILGYARLIDDATSEAERRDHLDAIRRNGEHLLRLINDVLDLSKIEAGRYHVDLIPTPFREPIEQAVETVTVKAAAKGLPLRVVFDGPLPETIETDPFRLKQVLINLLDNAVKFTETGEVRLRVVCEEVEGVWQCRMTVADTGVGMTARQIDTLFQPFTQADASTTRRFGGTGLGLTISRQIIEKLGGSVDVASEAMKGTVFTLVIPGGAVSDHPPAADPAALGDASAHGEVDEPAKASGPTGGPLGDARALTLHGDAGSSEIAAPAHATAPSKPVEPDDAASLSGEDACDAKAAYRVLLAEDTPDGAKLVSLMLRRLGCEVTHVEDGREAVAAVSRASERGEAFNLILMDIQMPVMDGHEATRLIRREGYSGRVVALTANAQSSDRQAALEAGCDDFATKPVSPDRLSALIRPPNRTAA